MKRRGGRLVMAALGLVFTLASAFISGASARQLPITPEPPKMPPPLELPPSHILPLVSDSAIKPVEPFPLGRLDRGSEVLLYQCTSPLGKRDVTLFGNGTIRLRDNDAARSDGKVGQPWMGLAELNPDDLQGMVNRLAAEDLKDVGRLPPGIDGAWVERCELSVALPDRPAQKFRFSRYDSLPLPLARLLRLVDELAAKVTDFKAQERLPHDYLPKIGDVLKRGDGVRFRIVGYTSDHKGIELSGVDQPIELYLRPEEVQQGFVAVERAP
ncbi:MAG TPA: hypothetical protein VGE98_14830 [Thermoanaerobaculia bacterium]